MISAMVALRAPNPVIWSITAGLAMSGGDVHFRHVWGQDQLLHRP